jgi:two-component system, NtrC family, sensor histidine kinase KinB
MSSISATNGAISAPTVIRAPSLVRLQRQVDVPTRWTLVLIALWVLYRSRGGGIEVAWQAVVALYAFFAVAMTAYWFTRGEDAAQRRRARVVAYASFAFDGFFACVLIWRDGGAASPLYILLVLLALKAILLSTVLPRLVWLPFAFGPLYVGALGLAAGSLAFLTDPAFLGRYALLWVWLIGAVIISYELRHRTAETLTLSAALRRHQAALAQKSDILQRTATDLGDRLLELRALQEAAKALATTLRTEETLELVVETLARATGSSHCAVALIDRESASAAREGAALEGALLSDGHSEPALFRIRLAEEPATLAASESARPLRVEAARAGRLGLRLGRQPYLVTTLVSRGHAIGAIYVAEQVSATPRPGASPSLNTSEQLLTSFAYFAATAIENARLYQDAYEKRRELEAVLAGIGDGVVVADTDLSLILMNPVARHILGLEAEPPGGIPLRPYLSSPAFAELLAGTLESGQEQIRELDMPAPVKNLGPGAPATERGPAGALRTYGALASPVLDAAGEVSGVVAVLRDITAQKEVERMKSNFLSVVSHELRTPLHSIKGFVEIILMGKTGPVSELQEDFLKTVRTQTTVLQRMIDDLLEFSRMEAGRIKLNLEEVDLASLAHSVATKLAPLAQDANLTLYMDFPHDLPAIDADRVRLEQVLTNLVENAIKFTPAHGEVTIGARRMEDRVCLTVRDTGIGIPLEEQQKVFDRFYQVDRGEKRAYRGTGLGLSICRHIVERHSGCIWAESDGIAGHGSSFHVDLPIELRPEEAPTIDFASSHGATVALRAGAGGDSNKVLDQ